LFNRITRSGSLGTKSPDVQPLTFLGRDRDSIRQPAVQNPILFFEKLDHPGEFAVRGDRKAKQQGLEQSTHLVLEQANSPIVGEENF